MNLDNIIAVIEMNKNIWFLISKIASVTFSNLPNEYTSLNI